MVFCFEIGGYFGGVRTVPHFGLFFRSRRDWHINVFRFNSKRIVLGYITYIIALRL